MEYIIQLWEKHLDPLLSPLWDSLNLWRTLALLLATILVLVFLYRDKILQFLSRPKHQEHDRDIFNLADEILPEQKIYDTLDTLEANHLSNDDEFRQMLRFEWFYDLETNRFLDTKIHIAAKRLSDALAELTNFISYNFFTMGNSVTRQYLYPDLNVDRGGNGSPEDMQKYRQYSLELRNFTKQVRESYKNFRSLIKQRLLK